MKEWSNIKIFKLNVMSILQSSDFEPEVSKFFSEWWDNILRLGQDPSFYPFIFAYTHI